MESPSDPGNGRPYLGGLDRVPAWHHSPAVARSSSRCSARPAPPASDPASPGHRGKTRRLASTPGHRHRCQRNGKKVENDPNHRDGPERCSRNRRSCQRGADGRAQRSPPGGLPRVRSVHRLNVVAPHSAAADSHATQIEYRPGIHQKHTEAGCRQKRVGLDPALSSPAQRQERLPSAAARVAGAGQPRKAT